MSFRRDHGQRQTRFLEAFEHGHGAFEQPDHVVVYLGIVFPVHTAQLLVHGRIIREIPHLGVEGLSHLGHETLVGDSLAQHRARRVAKRGEQQIVRVEQGPVQVEQNGLHIV